ncbi:hypothetical protein HN681_02325 [archaeon]|jgi:uncharacterized coiled-coil DUF342 family protein|nr:hypothetical protein [archaeon]MBT3731309.1 hypothetical protein [archaeon]MBT4669962.1 hypothetical protein [archaeon]MBT5029787.1 hypothetical protein [archaeon]MBT5287464.1 hypothetical protein [archaeon]
MSEAKKTEKQKVEVKEIVPNKDTNKISNKEVEAKKVTTEKVEAKKVTKEKVETKKVNTDKVETKKVNTEKISVENLEKLDVKDLKARLDDLNSKKEKWFEKKEELKESIAKLISEVKNVKSENDKFSKEIKALKDKRDKFNKEVKILISKIKIMNPGKIEDRSKKPSVGGIKKKIDELERKIEMGMVSFDQEKKLMKQIKSLRKEYNEVQITGSVGKDAKDLSKKIDDAKKLAEDVHQKIKTLAGKNKNSYKKFVKTSKEINKIKKEQEDAFDKFIKFKQAFSETNKILKKRVDVVHKKKSKRKEKITKDRKMIEERKLEEQKSKVEEKIKKKKILTTEDLIAFQGK